MIPDSAMTNHQRNEYEVGLGQFNTSGLLSLPRINGIWTNPMMFNDFHLQSSKKGIENH